MKLCYIANPRSIHIHRIFKFFNDCGYDLHLIYFECIHSSSSRPEIENVTCHRVAYASYIGRDLQIPFDYMQLLRLIKRIRPDILHGFYVSHSGWYGALLNYRPYMATVLGSDVMLEPSRSRSIHKRVQYVLNKADVVHSVSDTLTEMIRKFEFDTEKIVQTPIGIDTSLFNPGVKPEFTKKYVVICTRNFEEIYNVKLFIESMPYVLNEIPDATFILAGKGKLRPELEALVKKLELEDKVKFLGAVHHSQLPPLLTAADVYVSTPLSESLGISNLEAMACGTFPIATDLPAVREWITDGKNGFLVPNDDPEILGEKIITALQNTKLRKSVKKKNIQIIHDRAKFERNMEIIKEQYERLLKSK